MFHSGMQELLDIPGFKLAFLVSLVSLQGKRPFLLVNSKEVYIKKKYTARPKT